MTEASAPQPEQIQTASLNIQDAAKKIDAPKTETKPDFLLPKYKTVEEQAKAYVELEKKLGQQQQKPEDPKVEAPKPGEQPKAETPAPLEFTALQNEIDTTGSLSPETYQRLEAAGINKQFVDTFIAKWQANNQYAAAGTTQEVFKAAGISSQEEFTQLQSWAAQNLSEAELGVYNEAAKSGQSAKVGLALAGIRARYQAANGVAPQRMLHGNSIPPAKEAYQSTAQMITDMRNPLYKTDPAFRAMVEQKIANSG